MKNIIKNITLCGLVAAGTGMGLSSCEDFLTITPTDRIVEEEFWQDKRDLNNAVMACYWRMSNSDLLTKYIYWGEERSDNFETGPNIRSTSAMANIMNANLLPTYDQFSWTPMYNAINYCNKVIAHGEDVVAIDESFSENDWRPIRAEAIALRALCHFYLVRTFGEIPYITEDFNNDSQELRTAQSTQLTVLNNIINDLESIKDEAMVDYGYNSNPIAFNSNKNRITRKAVHTLLADVYLWRASYKAGGNQPFKKVTLASNYAGEQSEAELTSRYEDYGTSAEEDYRKCIEYCDLVIERSMQEKREKLSMNGNSTTSVALSDLLVSNEFSTRGVMMQSAYNSIFGTGNSDETILEFPIDGVASTNSMVSSLYMDIKSSKSGSGSLAGAKNLLLTIASDGPNSTNYANADLFTRTDLRRYATIAYPVSINNIDIIKYVEDRITQSVSATYVSSIPQYDSDSEKDIDVTQSTRQQSNSNWIVYRMPEVFLMKAEAMSQLYTDRDNLKEAFKYVREVFKRSNTLAYLRANPEGRRDTLNENIFVNSNVDIEGLVMAERQREFIGEGKRWYDLVRYALRRGNTAEMLNLLVRKYGENRGAIKAKLADMQTLFSPVYNSEIKNNSLLYQNGVWSVNETSSRTDEL